MIDGQPKLYSAGKKKFYNLGKNTLGSLSQEGIAMVIKI
jgi:hypothetical protein